MAHWQVLTVALQTPPEQASPLVQALPSSQAVASSFGTLTQVPVLGAQTVWVQGPSPLGSQMTTELGRTSQPLVSVLQ